MNVLFAKRRRLTRLVLRRSDADTAAAAAAAVIRRQRYYAPRHQSRDIKPHCCASTCPSLCMCYAAIWKRCV